MCANKSNTEENSRDKIWYGWIPKLSHEIIVKTGYGNKFFDEVTGEELKKFSDHKITSCECCK